MISTVRGDDVQFMAHTLGVEGSIQNAPDNWMDYTESSNTKLKLPGLGVWKIYLDTNYSSLAFELIEGTEKEPVVIVTNASELIINAVEREDLKDNKDDKGAITVREDADDPNGVNVGGEGHEGQTWDNQFFIVANRELKANEETVVEFDYVATADATCGTSAQGNPGDWMGGAIENVSFTTTEQLFKHDFKAPKDGVKSIAIDLACIKAANTYTIKNVKWYLKGDENTEGKTWENLIDETGTKNFKVKIGAGTAIVDYGTDGISTVAGKKNVGSAVIYNLAGQRVSNGFKGIVVKDGKKYVK